MKITLNLLVGFTALFIFACNDNQISSTVNNIQNAPYISAKSTDQSSEIDVKSGEEFTIVLPAEKSKDYKWSLDSELDPVMAKFVSSRYEPANEEMGIPGKYIWTFKALTRGNTGISLKYTNKKDKIPSQIQTFSINIKDSNTSKINLKFLTDLKNSLFG